MKKKVSFMSISASIAFLFLLYSWYYILYVDGGNLSMLFSEENATYLKRFLAELAGIHEETPAFMDREQWKIVFQLSMETLVMSIMAICLASFFVLITVIHGARNISDGSLLANPKWYQRFAFYAVRLLYILTRSVPELIWAMMIILIFRPGVIPGVIALAIHNYGVLGKLCSEVIENLDSQPIQNLHASGASNGQKLLYGIFPMVLPSFMTYIVYRWEVIIRTTIILGFIGAGGLGKQFRLSMSSFHYSQITMILMAYLLLVFFAEGVSKVARKLSG